MRYDPSSIEKKWQERWQRKKIYEPNLKSTRRPFYNLMMFPYPSAEGLHVGNMYAFTGADIYGRLKRMQGYDVFEPIGLDGFGIHSENYALSIGKHPADQAKISEKRFYRQLEIIGNGFAWDEKLETYDPEYYRWTQWIFGEMFRRGLAYRKKSPVNWCPSCKTVLADEQVIAGECERCSTRVIKKELEQWFFKITAYAERLLKNLETIDWSEKIKVAQRNWIGKSEGALIKFQVKSEKLKVDEFIEVFTTRPDTLFGATYMVLAPEHPLVGNLRSQITNYNDVEAYVRKAKAKTDEERIAEGREKTGVELKGVKAVNPANSEEIPVWVADYVLGHVGTGAIMAVPAHDHRDFEFAKKFKLPIRVVIKPSAGASEEALAMTCHVGPGVTVNSGRFTGMPSEQAKWEIAKLVSGKKEIHYRLRDWLISRQRYWGPPIPMIYCNTCAKVGHGEQKEMPGWYAVPEKDLPVKLPYIKNFRPTGTEKSPLAEVEKFYKVRCPRCKSWARRETDVSDTFLDSAWYYLGYLILGNQKSKIKNQKSAFDKAIIKKWLPVDMYIGGAEHAVLHLLYVRFLAMAFHDWELIHFDEPFKKFRAHGLLIKDGAKMSKSRGNVVNPDEYIRAYGADALRMYLMFLGPFEQGGDFRDTGIRGITRFLERVWRFVQSQASEIPNSKFQIPNPEGKPLASYGAGKSQIPNPRIQNQLDRVVARTVKKVTDDIEGLQYNTAISALMILLNTLEGQAEVVTREQSAVFLRLLAPFAPHISEELWHELGEEKSIHLSAWPKSDKRFLKAESQTIIVQINGRMRDRIEISPGASEADVRASVLARPKVKQWVGSGPVRKFIYVPGRIVSIVT